MAQKVTIRIYADGRIEAKTVGVKGSRCLDYIRMLEGLLDAETVSSKYTDEYYETDIEQHQTGEQAVGGG